MSKYSAIISTEDKSEMTKELVEENDDHEAISEAINMVADMNRKAAMGRSYYLIRVLKNIL